MKWLGLSLISAGYKANAHIIWDSPENPINLSSTLKKGLKREEPIFLHRCGDSLSETLHERPTPVRTARRAMTGTFSSLLKRQSSLSPVLYSCYFFSYLTKVTRIVFRDSF